MTTVQKCRYPEVRVAGTCGQTIHILPAKRTFHIGGTKTDLAAPVPTIAGGRDTHNIFAVSLQEGSQWRLHLVSLSHRTPTAHVQLVTWDNSSFGVEMSTRSPSFALDVGETMVLGAEHMIRLNLPDPVAFEALCQAEESGAKKQATISLRAFVTERAKSSRGKDTHVAVRDWAVDLEGLPMKTAAAFLTVVERAFDGDAAQTAGGNAESGEWNPDMSLHFVFSIQPTGTFLKSIIVAPRTEGPETQSAVQSVVRLDFLDGKIACEGADNPLTDLDGLYFDELAAIVQTAASRRAGAK